MRALEYGWNSGWIAHSRQLNTALVRGAATALNKEWGIMITWAYKQPPYMEPGPALYNDMVSAYENGAKYIIVFDSNEDWTENVLKQDQFDAMKQFWQYTQENSRNRDPGKRKVSVCSSRGLWRRLPQPRRHNLGTVG